MSFFICCSGTGVKNVFQRVWRNRRRILKNTIGTMLLIDVQIRFEMYSTDFRFPIVLDRNIKEK